VQDKTYLGSFLCRR